MRLVNGARMHCSQLTCQQLRAEQKKKKKKRERERENAHSRKRNAEMRNPNRALVLLASIQYVGLYL